MYICTHIYPYTHTHTHIYIGLTIRLDLEGQQEMTHVAAPSPRAKPRTAYGMRAHRVASAAGFRSATKLRLCGYTGRCEFSYCCRSAQKY